MKRLAWLLLLPLWSGSVFAQGGYSISGTVPNGTVGVAYSASLTVNPLTLATWSISAGTFPPGLTPPSGSSMAGLMGGTPTTAGIYSFTVQASIGGANAAPILVTQPYTVVIAGPAGSPVTISTTTLPNGVVGVSYSQGITATGGYGLGTYTYTLAQGTLPPGLQLNSTSGVIYGTPTTAGLSSFAMQVSSQAGGGPVLSGYAYLSINVSTPPLTITTSSLPAGAVGTAYSQTLAVTGGTPPYTWRVTSGSLPGGVALASNGNISGTPTAAGSFTIQVAVSDSQQGSASGTFTIKINPAALVITTTSLPAGIVGTAYTATALAATGGVSPYSWSVGSGALPSGLSISSGTISGTPAAAGSFTFQLVVTDSQQATATGTFTVRITAAALVITTTFLPTGTVGTAYTSTTLAATGGTPPYTWSVAPGSTLPGGLLLSSAGAVSGTPSAAGTFPVTLQVTDSAQVIATRSYSVAVAAPAVPLSITTTQSSVPSGQAGLAYTETFAATGGTTPYSWYITAGALPPGLSLNQSAGSVTGTPTTAGTFTFTVEVADIADHSVFQPFTITVIAAVKITTPPSLADGVTGTPYTQQFAASGGVAPYLWSVAAGSIPSGLSLSTSTGLLSGTPTTPGTYNFTIGVVDQSKQTDSVAYTVKIVASLSITTATTLPGGVVGAAYAQTFASTGGTSPYQWSVSTGTLPTGLTLNASTGSLAGTPTAAGTFTFTIRVADGAARSATATFTMVVTTSLSITTATLPNGTVGAAYNQTLAAAGASGITLTWSVSTGALPAGITLSSSAGSLTGTPTAPGASTFTVSVTGGGQTATQSLTITVGVPLAPAVTITGLPVTASPATQPALGITIPSAYPLAITGTVTLTFAPDAPSPDGQEVVFTTGGRTVGFTVPANTTQVAFSGATPAVQTGTVSGTITLTLKLTAAGIDVTPSPAPSTSLKIAKAAPVIKTATVTRTSTGFNLVVVGYATSREMVSAAVTFTAAAGVTLASSQATVSLSSVFTTWYADPTSAAYGSNFSLTMPFTFSSSTAPLTSVSVQLTSAQGNSNSMSANY